ncbi:MAG: hypothetical protein ACRERY_17650 [Pseudomonas sp.]
MYPPDSPSCPPARKAQRCPAFSWTDRIDEPGGLPTTAESSTLAGMGDSTIPDDVRRFLLAAIPSVPHLEALLLLRTPPSAGWTAALLARRLYVDAHVAARLLGDLERAGLARRDADRAFVFAPHDPDLGALVDRVAAVYARQVVGVAELIHSSSDRKAQRFADAFRWRKDP